MGEVLHVNAAAGGAVEPLDSECVAFQARGVGRKSLNVGHTNQLDRGNLDAYRPRQFEHGVFVFGDGGELHGGKLDDPRPADTMGRDRQTAGSFRYRRELKLDAGQREAHDAALHLAFFPHIALTMSRIAIVTARVHRPECDRAGNISAEYGHEIELPFGLDARLFGQVVPQVSFRQQVREERR